MDLTVSGLRPPHAARGPHHVLILMSRTGGGHLASARALEAEIVRQAPHAAVTIVDLLTDHIAYPFSRLPPTYDTVVNRTPMLWKAMWSATAYRAVARPSSAIVRRVSRAKLEELVRKTKPDLVISVHPLVNALMIPVLGRLSPRTRYVTVVTDLGAIHPLWLHPKSSAIYLPTAKAVDAAVARGLPRERLHAHGLPIRAEFGADPPDRATARAAFGLSRDLPAILVVGGGGGVGPIEKLVDALSGEANFVTPDGRPRAQIVVVAGNNAALRGRIAGRTWPMPVVALAFVERMSDLMHACDLLVTKAGPGTIAEACVRGLPMLIYGFIPGQEAANVDHVVDAGAGLFEPKPKRLAAAAVRLIVDGPAELRAMSGRSRALGREQATRDIVASILAGS